MICFFWHRLFTTLLYFLFGTFWNKLYAFLNMFLFNVPAHGNIIYLFTGSEDGSKFFVPKTATFSRGEAKKNSCCRGGEVKQTWCQININFLILLKWRNRFKFWFFCFVTVVIFWNICISFVGWIKSEAY